MNIVDVVFSFTSLYNTAPCLVVVAIILTPVSVVAIVVVRAFICEIFRQRVSNFS